MTRVRRIQDLLESNRVRNQRAARVRPELSGRDGRPLRARRESGRRDGRRVQLARLFFVVSVAVLAFALWNQRVDRVEIEGLVLAPVQEVHRACAPLLGQSWLGLDTSETEVRLSTEPWLERVEIERRLPSSVVVRVEEARPVLRVDDSRDGVAVDEHGCLLPASDRLDVSSLPRLAGVEVEHGRLRQEQRLRIARLVEALGAAAWPWTNGLDAVTLRERGEIELRTAGGVHLRLDADDLVAQLRAAEAAWEDLDPREGDRLDLRFRRQVILARADRSSEGG